MAVWWMAMAGTNAGTMELATMEHRFDSERTRIHRKDTTYMCLEYLGIGLILLFLPFEPVRAYIPSWEFVMMVVGIANGAVVFFVALRYRHALGIGRFSREIQDGQAALNGGRFLEARACCERALRIRSFETAWVNLAITLAYVGQYREAIEAFGVVKQTSDPATRMLRVIGVQLPGAGTLPPGTRVAVEPGMLDGTDPDTWVFLANIALQMQDVEGAKQLMARYIVARPNDLNANKRWGAFLYEHEDYAAAVPVLTRVVDLEPGSKEGWILLVRCLLLKGDIEGAAPNLERARGAGIDGSSYWSMLSHLLTQKGDVDGAIASLERARSAGFNEGSYWRIRANLLNTKRDYDGALTAVREARARNPDDRDNLTLEFDLSMRLKRFDAAVTLMEGVLQKMPDDAHFLALLGMALIEKGDFERADIVTARATKDAHVRHPVAGWARGQVLIKKEAVDQAIGVLQENLRTFPDHVPSQFALSVCLGMKENYQAEITLLEPLVSKYPQESAWLNNLGVAYAKTGDKARALALYQKGLEIAPESPFLLSNMAGYYIDKETRDLPKARSLIERVIAHDPKHAYAWFNMAALLAVEGSTDSSLDNLEKALAIDPKLAKNARTDDEFRSLAGNPRFEAIVGKPDGGT